MVFRDNGRIIEAFPLAWPAAWPRTAAAERRRPKFHKTASRPSTLTPGATITEAKQLSVADGVARVREQLEMFGVRREQIIISTNVETRADGLPRSDRRALGNDPGVAVYWKDPDSGQSQCMAIDLYESVAGNLAAVGATIDAMRAIERHGGAQILHRAFQGFKALPGSGATTPTLSIGEAAHLIARLAGNPESTGLLAAPNVARDAIRRAKAKAHPDAGGRNEDWTLLQEAERIILAHHFGKL